MFDNATSPESVRSYIPASSRGSIIYTTQSIEFANICTSSIRIKAFDAEDGACVVRKYLTKRSYENHQPKIVSELVGGLPLAIAHIAGYVNSSQSSLQDFIDAFEDNRCGSKLWCGPPGSSTFQYEKSLAIVFDVALAALGSDARDLIDCLAFLNPDSIPEEMIFRSKKVTDKTTLNASDRFR